MSVSVVADFTHRLLCALLVIGGVELNPGPKCLYAKASGAAIVSGTSLSAFHPKLLSQPTHFLSDVDIMLIQQEVLKCRQEIVQKSDELREKAVELNMKDKLLAEKDERITHLLENLESMKSKFHEQEAKIAQLEKQNYSLTLTKDNEDRAILELKCTDFENEVESLVRKVTELSTRVRSLEEDKLLFSEKLAASENVVALKMNLIALCQEGDWRSALPLLSQCLSPGDPASQQLASVQQHRYFLAEAAAQGHGDLVREYLVHGFPPDTVISHDGTTLLHRAAWNGRTKLVELLLNYRAPVDSRDSVYSRTALMYAALGGHYKTLTYLLDNGAFINAVDGPGWSALHLSAMMGHVKVAWHLVSSGADTTLQSANGQTAEDIARQYHKEQVVALLSRCGTLAV